MRRLIYRLRNLRHARWLFARDFRDFGFGRAVVRAGAVNMDDVVAHNPFMRGLMTSNHQR